MRHYTLDSSFGGRRVIRTLYPNNGYSLAGSLASHGPVFRIGCKDRNRTYSYLCVGQVPSHSASLHHWGDEWELPPHQNLHRDPLFSLSYRHIWQAIPDLHRLLLA